MKRWSSDEAALPQGGATIRSARFDRPLRHGSEKSWGDAEVDREIRSAIEDGREQGRAAGYAVGWAQGRRGAAEAEAEVARVRDSAETARRGQESARFAAVLTALAAVGPELERTTEPAWHEVADAITDGALQLAAAALGRELAALDAPVLDAVRTAVRTVSAAGGVTVRLHPQDHASLCGPNGLAPAAGLPDGVRLIADAELAPGEVRAASVSQRLRLHLPAALGAAEEVLRG